MARPAPTKSKSSIEMGRTTPAAKHLEFKAPTDIQLARKRRLRVPTNMPRPYTGETPWSRDEDEREDWEKVADLRATPEYQEFVLPELLAIDARRSARGVKFLYTSDELEAIWMFKDIGGFDRIEDCLLFLEGPRGERARMALGIDQPRLPGWRLKRFQGLDGVPAKATLVRHRTRYGKKQRAEAWKKAQAALRDRENKTTPDEELRVLNMDGNLVDIVYHGATYTTNEKGERVLDKCVTAPEAGASSKRSHAKGAHGFCVVSVFTSRSRPQAWEVVPNTVHESKVGERLVRDQLAPVITAVRDGREGCGVLNCDSAYATPAMRSVCRPMGYVENTHSASHGKRSTDPDDPTKSKREVEYNKHWIPFRRNRNWGTNGHRELMCKCGKSQVSRVHELDPNGNAVCRVEARCATHGTFTVTSGEYVLVDGWWDYPDPNDPSYGKLDLAVGNSLTFNDPLAAAYGTMRWSHNEGVHGVLASRYKLTKGKKYFRTIADVETAFAIVYASLHEAGIRYNERMATGPPAESPPLAALAS